MKTLLSFTLSFLLSIASLAQTQDWKPIRTDDTYFYVGNEEYRSYRIDSVVKYSDSTLMYSYAELFALNYADCFNPFGPSWLAKKIKTGNDSTLIYNYNNEAITLLHNPKIGSTWNLYTYTETQFIQAEVTSRTYENIGFTEDSILTLKLSSTDNLNGKEIILSKNHGMVKGFNFLLFPNINTEFQYLDSFKLCGLVSNTASKANLTALDIYNFDVGDEFHTHYYSYEATGENSADITDKKAIKKVIEKTYNSDSSEVNYKYNLCDKTGEHITEQTFPLKSEYLNQLPYHPIYTASTLDSTDDKNFVFCQIAEHSNTYRNKEFGGNYIYQNDSCYEYVLIDKKKSSSMEKLPFVRSNETYIEGMGGPYFDHNFMYNGESYNLVYYKKGTTQWGTPYNCDDIVGVNDAKNKVKINVYPNPASNYITIETSNAVTNSSFIILNSLGQKVFQQALVNKKAEINIKGLPKGIFLYQIKQNGERVHAGKFIKN